MVSVREIPTAHTPSGGYGDVMAVDFTTAITVGAAFEDGVLVLRPEGLPGVEVRRWREGGQLVWQYHTLFTARLDRFEGADDGVR